MVFLHQDLDLTAGTSGQVFLERSTSGPAFPTRPGPTRAISTIRPWSLSPGHRGHRLRINSLPMPPSFLPSEFLTLSGGPSRPPAPSRLRGFSRKTLSGGASFDLSFSGGA